MLIRNKPRKRTHALQYTGQPLDCRIKLKLPNVDGLFVLELYLGGTSGRCLVDETHRTSADDWQRSGLGEIPRVG
jgi:hypothetical protein